MYTVTITRDFVAQHFLIGGDWGAENQWHSHHYKAEVRLEGATLDQHGYLVTFPASSVRLSQSASRPPP